MPDTIPRGMRAVLVERYEDDLSAAVTGLRIVERSVPVLSRGQVLVQMAAAPCNPSDLLLLQGRYGTLKSLPTVPGWEGAGRVVAAGPGWLSRWLKGKRVACALQEDRDGTWAEYFVANADECIPLKREMPTDQAAGLIVNPLTAMGLLDTAKRSGHRAAVHTAAASQLGRMILVLAKTANYPIIHVVRRDAQVDLLKSLGAEDVLNSSEEGFSEKLQEACVRRGATAAFEAVGGETTGVVVNAMPRGSTAYVYGALSGEACGNIDPISLIFQGKAVRGFYLGEWLRGRSMLGVLRAAGRLQRMIIDGSLQTKVQRRLNLDEVVEGLRQYVDHMTDGKVLIMPNKR